MKKFALLLPLALIAAALALSACGGGGSSPSGGNSSIVSSTPSTGTADISSSNGSASDEAAIEETMVKVSTTKDPSKCTELQTPKYNEEGGRVSAAEGLHLCESANEVSQAPANSVDVLGIDVEGEKASVEAAFKGSTLNGQTLGFELVKEAGKWKLNQFLSFVHYDAKAAGEGVEERLENIGSSTKVVKCMGSSYAEFSQREAEEVSMEGNIEPIEELLSRCG